MADEQKITIYWETKIEHKKVIFGTEEEINSIIESLDSDNAHEYLEGIECSIETEQLKDSVLDFYQVEDQD